MSALRVAFATSRSVELDLMDQDPMTITPVFGLMDKDLSADTFLQMAYDRICQFPDVGVTNTQLYLHMNKHFPDLKLRVLDTKLQPLMSHKYAVTTYRDGKITYLPADIKRKLGDKLNGIEIENKNFGKTITVGGPPPIPPALPNAKKFKHHIEASLAAMSASTTDLTREGLINDFVNQVRRHPTTIAHFDGEGHQQEDADLSQRAHHILRSIIDPKVRYHLVEAMNLCDQSEFKRVSDVFNAHEMSILTDYIARGGKFNMDAINAATMLPATQLNMHKNDEIVNRLLNANHLMSVVSNVFGGAALRNPMKFGTQQNSNKLTVHAPESIQPPDINVSRGMTTVVFKNGTQLDVPTIRSSAYTKSLLIPLILSICPQLSSKLDRKTCKYDDYIFFFLRPMVVTRHTDGWRSDLRWLYFKLITGDNPSQQDVELIGELRKIGIPMSESEAVNVETYYNVLHTEFAVAVKWAIDRAELFDKMIELINKFSHVSLESIAYVFNRYGKDAMVEAEIESQIDKDGKQVETIYGTIENCGDLFVDRSMKAIASLASEIGETSEKLREVRDGSSTNSVSKMLMNPYPKDSVDTSMKVISAFKLLETMKSEEESGETFFPETNQDYSGKVNLSAGTGYGSTTWPIAQFCPNADLVACDIQMNEHQEYKFKKNVTKMEGGFGHIKFFKGTFREVMDPEIYNYHTIVYDVAIGNKKDGGKIKYTRFKENKSNQEWFIDNLLSRVKIDEFQPVEQIIMKYYVPDDESDFVKHYSQMVELLSYYDIRVIDPIRAHQHESWLVMKLRKRHYADTMKVRRMLLKMFMVILTRWAVGIEIRHNLWRFCGHYLAPVTIIQSKMIERDMTIYPNMGFIHSMAIDAINPDFNISMFGDSKVNASTARVKAQSEINKKKMRHEPVKKVANIILRNATHLELINQIDNLFTYPT